MKTDYCRSRTSLRLGKYLLGLGVRLEVYSASAASEMRGEPNRLNDMLTFECGSRRASRKLKYIVFVIGRARCRLILSLVSVFDLSRFRRPVSLGKVWMLALHLHIPSLLNWQVVGAHRREHLFFQFRLAG